MTQQIEFSLRAQRRGFHLITDEVMAHLPQLPKIGLHIPEHTRSEIRRRSQRLREA